MKDFDQVPEDMPVGDGTVFVIRRFDRTPAGRTHIEDFGQILDRPPGHSQYVGSYEEIASVIRWISPESAEELLKTIVFHVLCGNGDAHLKNFSVTYPDCRNAVLSPACDIVSTILYLSPGKEELALTLAGQRKFAAVRRDSFASMIEKLGLDQSTGDRVVMDFRDAALDAWRKTEIQSAYSRLQVKRLQEHLDSLMLVVEQ